MGTLDLFARICVSVCGGGGVCRRHMDTGNHANGATSCDLQREHMRLEMHCAVASGFHCKQILPLFEFWPAYMALTL